MSFLKAHSGGINKDIARGSRDHIDINSAKILAVPDH